jgi:hypothetical protein
MASLRMDKLVDKTSYWLNTLMNVQTKTFTSLSTTKVWQDVFSDYPFTPPIADYWIWAG